MGLRINNNVEAFNAHRNLTATSNSAAKSMERLSSGFRINRAADDAAGLAISEKMRGQIGGLAQAQRNAQDGVSLVQTGEGALTEVHSMLQRIRELKVQYDNGTLGDNDKIAIGNEVKALANEIGEIQANTKFNDVTLLDGAGGDSGTISLQVGANGAETIDVVTSDIEGGDGMAAVAALKTATIDADSLLDDDLSLEDIDAAIGEISTLRSDFGAVQNRLEHRLNNLAAYQENLVASESRIRDVDMAQEMVKFTKLQILQQAGTSMLAQANQAPQGVLSLLR
jgi:flagellin